MTQSEFTVMRTSAEAAARSSAAHAWSVDELDWQGLRPEHLTDDDRTIVRFLTFVEDHIPAYLTFALSAFPTTGDMDASTYRRNREYFRFLLAWGNDEEKHASALVQYQIRAEIADGHRLAEELADVGRTPWSLPYEDPLELFVYTFLQEKATQLFYQRYQHVVGEPVLKELLARLARDEARHFAFYSRLVESSLRSTGRQALDGVRNVLSTFRMPLDGSLDGYWRMGLAAVDAVGHDHTEAYDAIGKLVRRFADQLGAPEVEDLDRLIRSAQRMP
ncbi:acyl-ACP desaturase [Allokutzneria sp. A3M-2-11 16]|uniref:acyl-ACP desaturase n=1 Tax=Allokutzneria sp. A3M-2-11 16 TaxID=2962043 RepID=UPI0020B8C673|nr:acyl-ACP desaturase [Allokutzneria sp. A3M-2-11 16]MCP3802921.1 acyl-ACP desaturase [Allokutzneria sp. A3M-2-11 16]